MSAESEIAGMLNTTQAAIRTLSARADSLVNFAASAVAKIPGGMQHTSITDAGRGGNKKRYTSSKTALGLPNWHEITLDSPPSVIGVDDISMVFNLVPPTLRMPRFDITKPSELCSFSAQAPQVDVSFKLPNQPDPNINFIPAWGELDNLYIPIFETIKTDIELYKDGEVTVELKQIPDLYAGLVDSGTGDLPGAKPIIDKISDRSAKIIDQLFTPLKDYLSQVLELRYSLVSKALESAIALRLADRVNDEKIRGTDALKDRSGWDIPHAVQGAMAAHLKQVTDSWDGYAKSQQKTNALEFAKEMFELSSTLHKKLVSAINELKAKELELVLDAHRYAVLYATKNTEMELQIYQAENFSDYELVLAKTKADYKKVSADLKIALFQYEIANAKLEYEKAKQTNNKDLVTNYTQQIQAVEADIKLIAAQVAAAEKEVELNKLPYEAFKSQVAAYNSQAEAYAASIRGIIAEIEGNSAKADMGTAEIAIFEAQIQGFIAETEAKQVLLESQKTRNEALIEKYRAEVKAALAPVEQSIMKANYTLAEYEAAANQFIAETRMSIKETEIAQDYNSARAKGQLEANKMSVEYQKLFADTELDRIKALTDAAIAGARVYAHMAEGAMSAANGVASVIFSESA